MAYPKAGPFSNGALPSLNAGLFNTIENYLNPSTAKNGVPCASWFGPYSATTTPTFFNHNLVTEDVTGTITAQVPDLVLLVYDGTSVGTFQVSADHASMTTTQVKLTSTLAGGVTVYGVALKF